MMKRLFALLLCSALIAGCDSASRDNAEESNPRIRKGLEQAQLKQWNEAIRQFEVALSENTELARPDLELALIYQQQKKNYVRAIYHYESYLEKRPDSEKKEMIGDWIRQAKISFAAEIGQSAGDISEELIRLTRENNLLRQQLARMAVAGAHSKPLPAKPQPEPEPEPPVAAPKPTPVSKTPIPRIQTPAPVPETYKVLPGDTLSKIARAVYGDSSRYKEIYGANLDKMKSENDLRAGQIITIPKPGN
jgi:nucleoid-associated protein YgaU